MSRHTSTYDAAHKTNKISPHLSKFAHRTKKFIKAENLPPPFSPFWSLVHEGNQFT